MPQFDLWGGTDADEVWESMSCSSCRNAATTMYREMDMRYWLEQAEADQDT